MTYANIYNSYIVEPLMEIMGDEFKFPIGFTHKGGQSLLISLRTDDLEDLRGRGQLRKYVVEVEYQLKGIYKKSTIKQIADIAERFKRMVDDNRNFTVESTWVDEHGTWGSTTTVWSISRNTYCWHSGHVESIDYEQDEEAESNTVKMIFSCYREETI